MPKYAFTTLVLSVVLPSLAAAQAAQTVTADAVRLAYFSPQRAFFQSNDGKVAEARLSSLQSQTTREVLAWADPNLDITADVVAAVNQPAK
jgi:Skp family chaperone for outer membrane proteins